MHAEMESDTARCSNTRSKLLLSSHGKRGKIFRNRAPVLDLSAKSAVVMEQESKEILFAKDKDKELAPASVTKIMSLLLIFEDLKQGKINLQIRLQSVNMQHLWAALRCFWKQERSSRYKH